MFYQHVTDETFDMLIKKAVVLAEEISTNNTKPLTFEEENATRYVGGYVVRVLHQHTVYTTSWKMPVQKGQHKNGRKL